MPNLTPLSYLVIALISTMGVLHQWSDDSFPWWLLALTAWLIGLAYEWTRIDDYQLTAAVADSRPLRLGCDAGITIRFENAGSFPINVQFVADLPAEFDTDPSMRTLMLPGSASTNQQIDLRPLKLGRFSWPRLPARALGP